MLRRSLNPTSLKFRGISTFIQDAPRHENPYKSDAFLRRILQRIIPQDVLQLDIESDLLRFGEECSTNIQLLGEQCENEQPYLKYTSAWGKL